MYGQPAAKKFPILPVGIVAAVLIIAAVVLIPKFRADKADEDADSRPQQEQTDSGRSSEKTEDKTEDKTDPEPEPKPEPTRSMSDYTVYYSNINGDPVQDGYTAPETNSYCPDFWVSGGDLLVQSITTYHWNSGKGMEPGSIVICDWDTGEDVGEWQAVGRDGSGVQNVNWDVFPDITLKDGGHYYIRVRGDGAIDSWSFNDAFDSTQLANMASFDFAALTRMAGGVAENADLVVLIISLSGAAFTVYITITD